VRAGVGAREGAGVCAGVRAVCADTATGIKLQQRKKTKKQQNEKHKHRQQQAATTSTITTLLINRST
jgi:hypothetical protein